MRNGNGMDWGYFMFGIIYFIDIDRMGYCLPGERNVFWLLFSRSLLTCYLAFVYLITTSHQTKDSF
jgi:hypothetical protein